jgi:peptide/nickel transport system substrate-binding protein
MKKIIALALVVSIFASCGGDKKEQTSTEAKGGVYYGGVFRMNELEDFKNLYPLSTIDVGSHRIANQVYEGLVKLNPADLSVVPGVAYRWESNETQDVWTFHLRAGVKFHDDPCFTDGKGRVVTAQDFKYCFDKSCEASANNSAFDITFKNKVKGANEAFAASKLSNKAENVTGIVAVNDSTLTISLTTPNAEFLNVLSTPGCYVYPKEASEKYGVDMRTKCVGTGPFMVKTIKEGEVVILEKNKNYWGVDENGNQLPYLDAIKFTFIKEKKSEMLEFQRGNLDMVFRIPIEMYKEIMGDYQNANARKTDFEIQTTAALETNFYGILVTSPAFSKKEARLAFNYAIDRNKIVDFTLQGQGVAGIYGVIPPVEAFKKAGLDFDGITGYTYDVDKAKAYMKQAGYPGGAGFPKITLTINSGGGERNQQVAEVIQKMLEENIGVKVEINLVPFAEQIDGMQSGKQEFFRTAWIADYPDPVSFLSLFYGKNVPAKASEKAFVNTGRFKNDAFDAKYEAAVKEIDQAKRYVLFKQCDQILIDEGALIPLFYDENDRLVQKNVKNFPINAMEYRDFTRVYIVPKDKMNPAKK